MNASARRPLVDFMTAALTDAGCELLHQASPDRAPFILSFETPSGERMAIVAYAFLATRTPTKNRPDDERSFQIKYGSKASYADNNSHELWQDPLGQVLHPVAEFVVMKFCATSARFRESMSEMATTAPATEPSSSRTGATVSSIQMTDAMMEKRAKENGTSFDEAIVSFLKEERPMLELQRRGRAEEVAAVVVFLLSKHATFVNGANYRVDGGSVATV